MFTGLIQSVGKIQFQTKGVLVEGDFNFSPLSIGDSVAVDGVCLTVVRIVSNGFVADISEETLSRTTLGTKLKSNGIVNLETALKLSDHLGGHLVSGHVDGLGRVLSLKELVNSWRLEIKWEEAKFAKYICEKGSIALNGISLTVADFKEKGVVFSIAVVPHTWNNTSLKNLELGELVNLEVDLMAKYTERILSSRQPDQLYEQPSEKEITKDWLAEQGWR